MPVLASEFYERHTTQVAEALLGKRLVRRARDGTTVGRIVEVEAYLHEQDSACHAARGFTPGNAAMFGPAGRAYVYPIHSRYCFNAVTLRRGYPCAVLIRAVEPLDGIPLMQQRRGRTWLADLARGPARLCQAFAIDGQLNHWDLTRGRRLWIDDELAQPANWNIATSARIGVSAAQHLHLRYYVVDSPFVSGPRRLNTPVKESAG
ncbi:MAG: DNA-3-methyladenine glycosylase [Planctomycetota bacterium]